jgi:osmoprotectant transport system permease protein
MLPVLQNTYTGIKNVPVQLTNAARGMGMTEFQIMYRVQLPLAMPVIISGIRVASVWIIGTAALAAAIGGGGLGRLIFSGLSAIRNEVILAGALPATMLALIADYGLRWFQNVVGPERRARRIAHREEKIKIKA